MEVSGLGPSPTSAADSSQASDGLSLCIFKALPCSTSPYKSTAMILFLIHCPYFSFADSVCGHDDRVLSLLFHNPGKQKIQQENQRDFPSKSSIGNHLHLFQSQPYQCQRQDIVVEIFLTFLRIL